MLDRPTASLGDSGGHDGMRYDATCQSVRREGAPGSAEVFRTFMSYLLARNARVEEDLIDQLFNSSEKRLARTLLLLARYGKENQPQQVIAKISQETLAEMIGTTRGRVNFFMNKFKKLGFIRYNGGLHVDRSLLSVVLHE
jgi:CRP/FNR family transcriptional regulator, cyclic AMP receptor protein